MQFELTGETYLNIKKPKWAQAMLAQAHCAMVEPFSVQEEVVWVIN